MPRYFVLYKPYGFLSQFTREAPHHQTLADLYPFPEGVEPVGRLDQDSEGLLLLTDDRRLNQALLQPKRGHERTYLVQVEGMPRPSALVQLGQGVTIKVNKKPYRTRPARVQQLAVSPQLPDRDPPIRFRKTVPDCWLKLTLTEGKNRQVRKMCAAAGYPVLRLVRYSIERLTLDQLQPGEVREMTADELLPALQLDNLLR
ncbi:MAG: pseudouridine synthase [Lewinella sp.]|nr:pseudouridine synthase [Lewinella sp.]